MWNVKTVWSNYLVFSVAVRNKRREKGKEFHEDSPLSNFSVKVTASSVYRFKTEDTERTEAFSESIEAFAETLLILIFNPSVKLEKFQDSQDSQL